MVEFIQDMAAEVADLMKEKLSIRGKDLATKLRHTGRMMPKHIKREVAYLAEVCVLVKNPKLGRMIDHKQVEAAHLACVTFLQTVDVADRRKGVWLGVLGSLTLALMTVSTLVLGVLFWRGYL